MFSKLLIITEKLLNVDGIKISYRFHAAGSYINIMRFYRTVVDRNLNIKCYVDKYFVLK